MNICSIVLNKIKSTIGEEKVGDFWLKIVVHESRKCDDTKVVALAFNTWSGVRITTMKCDKPFYFEHCRKFSLKHNNIKSLHLVMISSQNPWANSHFKIGKLLFYLYNTSTLLPIERD